MCPAGHPLRSIIGNTTDISLPIALLLGFRNGCLLLLVGVLEDFRFARMSPHLGLTIVIVGLLIIGIIAFSRAWNWAGMIGPVKRLSARACGMAIGYLIPAVIASHSLYFHWVEAVEDGLYRQLSRLFEAAFIR